MGNKGFLGSEPQHEPLSCAGAVVSAGAVSTQAVAVAAGAAGAAAALLPVTACSSDRRPLQALTPSDDMDACCTHDSNDTVRVAVV